MGERVLTISIFPTFFSIRSEHFCFHRHLTCLLPSLAASCVLRAALLRMRASRELVLRCAQGKDGDVSKVSSTSIPSLISLFSFLFTVTSLVFFLCVSFPVCASPSTSLHYYELHLIKPKSFFFKLLCCFYFSSFTEHSTLLGGANLPP